MELIEWTSEGLGYFRSPIRSVFSFGRCWASSFVHSYPIDILATHRFLRRTLSFACLAYVTNFEWRRTERAKLINSQRSATLFLINALLFLFVHRSQATQFLNSNFFADQVVIISPYTNSSDGLYQFQIHTPLTWSVFHFIQAIVLIGNTTRVYALGLSPFYVTQYIPTNRN